MENSTNNQDNPTPSTENEETVVAAVAKDEKKSIGQSIAAGFTRAGNWMRSFFKQLLIGVSLLGVLALVVYMLYANYTYSEGTRAGDLIKISKKGLVFKTYEGQLKLGGIDLNNPSEGLSDTWSFSVRDEKIVEQLEQLQGQEVILRYKEINQSMPWQGDTNYFVYAIE